MKTCPFCAEEIQDAAIVCKHCHRDLLPKTAAATVAVAMPEGPIPDGAFDRDHYRRAFATFDAKGGAFAPVWNWGAFGFLFLWYLYRGLWVKALIILAVCMFTVGFAALPLCIYAGLAGDYDFYLLQRKQTQLWK